jgi:hypothetical protein
LSLGVNAAPALADRGSIHVTATGDLAFTDNVFAEQRGDQSSDLFVQVRPGVLMSYGTPRMIHDLSIEGQVTGYAIHRNDAAITGRAAWRALFLPTPRTDVTVQANAGSSLLNVLSVLSSPEQTTAVQPLGAVVAYTADVGEGFSYQLTRDLRLTQSLFGRAGRTDDNLPDPTITESHEAGVDVGIDRSFGRSAAAIEIGGSIVRFQRQAPAASVEPSRLDHQLNPRLRARYRYDLSRRLSLGVDVGLVDVRPYGTDPYNPGATDRKSGLFPLVGLNASWADVWGVASASVRRDMTPNLFIAQNTVNDAINAAVALPLRYNGGTRRAPKLVVVGAIALQRTQLIDPTTTMETSSIGIAQVSVGFQYAFRPALSYGVRYELMLQSGDDAAARPVPGFLRNTVFATFSVRYPEDVAFHVPRRRRDGERAGSRDASPIGPEPIIPDLVDGDSGEGDSR